MKKNRKVFDNEFRNSAIRYVQEHKELMHAQSAENLGVGKSTLARWISEANHSDEGIINMRGTGNYESDEAKEIARLKRELRDTKDALEILKKAINDVNLKFTKNVDFKFTKLANYHNPIQIKYLSFCKKVQ